VVTTEKAPIPYSTREWTTDSGKRRFLVAAEISWGELPSLDVWHGYDCLYVSIEDPRGWLCEETILLPPWVSPEDGEAVSKNGVLTVTFREEATTVREATPRADGK